MCLAVGNDFNPGGVHRFGPSKVKEWTKLINLNGNPQQAFSTLLTRLSEKYGCKKENCKESHSHVSSTDGFRCLVHSILHQPTHDGPLHPLPTYLGKYNKEYSNNTADGGPAIETCVGYPGQHQEGAF